MKSIFALLGIWIFAQSAFAHSVFVGNACEVLKLKDTYLLRDFYEDSYYTSEAPVIAQGSLRYLPDVEASPIINISISAELLAQKLDQLSLVHPDLPLYLLEVMKSYHWLALNHRFGLLQEDGDSLPAEMRMTLANRYLKTIRISLPVWTLLDETQKTAAVLHEVLFSVVKTETSGEVALQRSLAVKKVIAEIFKKDFNPALVRDFLIKNFSLPLEGPLLKPENRAFPDEVSFSVLLKSKKSGFETKKYKVQDASKEADLTAAVVGFCGQEVSSFSQPVSYSFIANRSAIGISENSYPTLGGVQIALKLSQRSTTLSRAEAWSFKNSDDCQKTLYSEIANWRNQPTDL
ncbi:hypothetical protein AZI86_10775 [Bdellovibrio bacteriovorus]|uniref:Uncharacterized protein n=1 Tax=Bdellovibrio bacteriovorus TaxID=959 RepID=A0A150WLM2_BDEBC|nr:hypothetical protein [Bdellovibrio bacteriovorus]KYG64687.1 hypothetical protein AZI86_10775 [Bdellovibrio bacteriovorus]